MAHNQTINIPLSFEYLMTSLFGKKKYHGYLGSKNHTSWKKDLLKIIKWMKKSIELNISSDISHQDNLKKLCENLEVSISNQTDFHSTNLTFIEHSIKIIFNLLGQMPNHWYNNAPWQNKHWLLNEFRTLSYVQTNEQKALIIKNYIYDTKTSINIANYQDIDDLFYKHCKGDDLLFINCIKDNYPKIYCDLF